MSPNPVMGRVRIILLGAMLCLAGADFLGCDPTPPVDENFDSSLGEDFKPPPPQGDAGRDAGADTGETSAP